MLVPATPDDLKMAGKITVAPNAESNNVKTVQIKVLFYYYYYFFSIYDSSI